MEADLEKGGSSARIPGRKERQMPVFSYLAYPVRGGKDALIRDLEALDHCEVMPAENEEVLILLTNTPDDEQEESLQERLKSLESLESLGMTFGHTDESPHLQRWAIRRA